MDTQGSSHTGAKAMTDNTEFQKLQKLLNNYTEAISIVAKYNTGLSGDPIMPHVAKAYKAAQDYRAQIVSLFLEQIKRGKSKD